VEKIIPVVERALRQAHPLLNPPPSRGRKGEGVDAIAVTAGPGLTTSLLVGVEVARTLSWLWKKPLVAVNHLAGHVYANWLLPVGKIRNPNIEIRNKFKIPNHKLEFPMLCLVVSGGHTELVLMREHLNFKIIGETRDDAAGEAFDKVAKMLGLGYPGGPEIARLSEKFHTASSPPPQSSPIKGEEAKGDSPPLVGGARGGEIRFPRPMINSNNLDFSFSGLKTAVLYYLRSQQKSVRSDAFLIKKISTICYEFQEAVVDVLIAKTIRAAKKYKVKIVLLGGGVAANKRLRHQLVNTVNRELKTVNCILPQAEYATDNAAMIAAAGYFMAQKKQFTPWQKLDVDSNWELGTKFKPLPR